MYAPLRAPLNPQDLPTFLSTRVENVFGENEDCLDGSASKEEDGGVSSCGGVGKNELDDVDNLRIYHEAVHDVIKDFHEKSHVFK